jgi:hypothetical protein
MVEHLGQRVASGGLDELRVLPAQARLRRAEEEEQHPGQQESGGEGHEHDVAPGCIQAGHDGSGIAPQADNRQRLAVVSHDWQVLLHHGRCGQRIAGRFHDPAFLDERRTGPATDGDRRASGLRGPHPHSGVAVAGQDPPIDAPDLDPQDAPFLDQLGEVAGQDGGAREAGPVGVDVANMQLVVHEKLNEHRVIRHDGVQARARQVGRDDPRQRTGRDAHQHEDHAEHEREQLGTA